MFNLLKRGLKLIICEIVIFSGGVVRQVVSHHHTQRCRSPFGSPVSGFEQELPVYSGRNIGQTGPIREPRFAIVSGERNGLIKSLQLRVLGV